MVEIEIGGREPREPRTRFQTSKDAGLIFDFYFNNIRPEVGFDP